MPRIPEARTQCGRLYNYLITGKSLTNWDNRRFSIAGTAFPRRIADLRVMGWNIHTETVLHRNADGRNVPISVYTLRIQFKQLELFNAA